SRPLPRVLIARNSPEARNVLGCALTERGQLPAGVHTPSREDPAGVLQLDPEGKVTLVHALPSIYLLQQLEQHAERRADGYYLTEAMVKTERSAGESIQQIIARWQHWQHGPLPPAILANIRRWGRFYGKARL